MKNMYVKIIILFALAIALVLSFYFYLSNIREQSTGENQVRASKVTEALMRNLDARYPPTPKEVVRFFAEITQCLYNDNYSQGDFEALGRQLFRLYDEELAENNPWEIYIDNLRFDVDSYRNREFVISSFTVSSSTDVIYFSEDGFDYARLHCLFSLRRSTDLYIIDHQFLLRRGENGRWKILGWQKEEPEYE
ncbi:MAG: hypothetical protein FWE14_12980 [Lachnospiraceae bacterium]|nr:hypothetical protein [Lachnospiraceae bacterium]